MLLGMENAKKCEYPGVKSDQLKGPGDQFRLSSVNPKVHGYGKGQIPPAEAASSEIGPRRTPQIPPVRL
jgi:hypothetical protein